MCSDVPVLYAIYRSCLCFIINAAVSVSEYALVSWMYFHRYVSLNDVPKDILRSLPENHTFMDKPL